MVEPDDDGRHVVTAILSVPATDQNIFNIFKIFFIYCEQSALWSQVFKVFINKISYLMAGGVLKNSQTLPSPW